MILYTTVEKEAHVEQTIEKSRFIAHIYPVDSREEADGIIASLRSQYKDATHNVPALVLGDKQQLQWASDDGEPSGTSGAPMVRMLVSEGLTNVLVVVTRYFGGIKLGTGGLVRAYTSSAKLALDEAGRHDVKEYLAIRVRLEYTLLSKLQSMERDLPYTISSVDYTDKIEAQLVFAPEDEDLIMASLNQISSGRVQILSSGKKIE